MDMRVFDSYFFNIIDKVRFGQTKPYLEKMLSELGYTYSNLGFSLDTYLANPLCEKVLQKFPSLKKYSYITDNDSFYLSSYPEKWNGGDIHADPADWDDISTVFSKIPRPFGFPTGKLVLDGINWYEDCNTTIALDYKHRREDPILYCPSIIQTRWYDDGLKCNTVIVEIEATAEPEPHNTIEIIEKLKPYLGEPRSHIRKCVFPKDENERIDLLERNYEKELSSYISELLPTPRQRTYDENVSVTKVTDKPTLEKAFANTGFKREDDNPLWLKEYSFIDEHGIKYQANIQKLSGGPEFRVWLEVYGYNFEIRCSDTDYFVEKNGESLEILKVFAAICVKAKDEYGTKLAKDFGDTPLWYWKKFV